jgi:hypothetical protein
MLLAFVHSLQSEWLKKRRSLSSIIVVVGAFFIPAILLLISLIKHYGLAEAYESPGFWLNFWGQAWSTMAAFLMPLGVILLTSLVTQIEYKNNTWKQVHTLPLPRPVIFFSKLALILAMMVQFILLFNLGIYLSAVIPSWVVGGVPYPKANIPFLHFLKEDLIYFLDVLPIVALQYLLALRFKNFLASVGIGFLLLVGSLMALSWKYVFLVPYAYCTLFSNMADALPLLPGLNIHLMAAIYFVGITTLAYLLFHFKKERG